jgi:stage IV sporulation protein FB
MKTILKIDLTTYLIIILSLFCARFKDIIILFTILTYHELGHLFWLKIYHKKVISITFYPFGGITKYNSLINHNIKEEFLIAIGGIINQLFLYLPVILLYNLKIINLYSYNMFINYNTILIIFNLLPIIPLDGSKLTNLILELFLPYHLANKLIIIISIITLLLTFFLSINLKINTIIIISFLLYQLILFIKNIKYLENQFILERYLHHLPYTKIKYLKLFNKNKLYQSTYHYFNYVPETKILANMFDKT